MAAPVYYRPAGPAFLHHRRSTINVGLGGMRVYSDEEMTVGERVELELLLSEATAARCWARVAWIEKLEPSDGAKFDIGLEFIDMADEDRRLLTSALGGV
ncbi:MAG: PilZ domain-containing protein [Candidatus Dormibacteraeota bacterium]|nr:PilZ domain-containing protein [Candidatus Dormibacteraeota bacterium]